MSPRHCFIYKLYMSTVRSVRGFLDLKDHKSSVNVAEVDDLSTLMSAANLYHFQPVSNDHTCFC